MSEKGWSAAGRRAARDILIENMETAAEIAVEAMQAGDGYFAMQMLRAGGVIAPAGQRKATGKADDGHGKG